MTGFGYGFGVRRKVWFRTKTSGLQVQCSDEVQSYFTARSQVYFSCLRKYINVQYNITVQCELLVEEITAHYFMWMTDIIPVQMKHKQCVPNSSHIYHKEKYTVCFTCSIKLKGESSAPYSVKTFMKSKVFISNAFKQFQQTFPSNRNIFKETRKNKN